VVRDPERALEPTCTLRFDVLSLLHDVVEAGLARQPLTVVADVECDRAAIIALKVSELVAMDLTDFLAVSEFLLCALLAHEALQFLVLAQRTIVIVHASQVNLRTLEAIV